MDGEGEGVVTSPLKNCHENEKNFLFWVCYWYIDTSLYQDGRESLNSEDELYTTRGYMVFDSFVKKTLLKGPKEKRYTYVTLCTSMSLCGILPFSELKRAPRSKNFSDRAR